jgi:Thymidylate synthase
MYIEGLTMDDILNKLYKVIQDEGKPVENGKGPNKEILGVYIRLLNPLSRMSRSFTRGLPISPLGELLWYLSGSDELNFIKYYLAGYHEFSDDGVTLYGAYGKRLFRKDEKINQIQFIVEKLRESPSTRQAVIQIYDAQDLMVTSKDIPCTCTLQFIIRENKLHLFTTMRSNDAFKGFVHDAFSFTMIQEIIARMLDIELGNYNHFVASMHLYDKEEKNLKVI